MENLITIIVNDENRRWVTSLWKKEKSDKSGKRILTIRNEREWSSSRITDTIKWLNKATVRSVVWTSKSTTI